MDKTRMLEHKIAVFLRWGVVIASLIIFAGWLWGFKWNDDPFFAYRVYDVFPLQRILPIYHRNDQWGVLLCYLGLVALISLPLIRVFLTACLFFKQKDFLLAGIALLVLVGLLASFTLGIEL